jgi:C4-dicarboxylate transporter DctQ subunit
MEATTYLFGWMVLIGMSYGIRVGTHIGVDLFVQRMSPGARRAVGIATVLLAGLYAALLLFGGYSYVDTMHTLGVEAEDLPVERWILLLALPLGFLLLLLRLAQLAWRILTGRQSGFHLADEAKEYIDQFDEAADGAAGEVRQ